MVEFKASHEGQDIYVNGSFFKRISLHFGLYLESHKVTPEDLRAIADKLEEMSAPKTHDT